MKNTKAFIYFIFSTLFLLSCGAPVDTSWKPKTEGELTKIWRLADIKFDKDEEVPEMDLMAEAMSKAVLEEGFMMCIFPKGIGSEIHGKDYNTFKWKLIDDNRSLLFKYPSYSDTIQLIDFETRKERGYLTTKYRDLGTFEFINAKKMLQHPKNDPFHPTNNKWRITPPSVEDTLALKKRLANHVQHYAYLLKASIDRDEQVVSFEFSQGIIKIYRGGIGVVSPKRISELWKKSFFNEEQAMATYEIFKGYLGGNTYKGATSGNWVKDDYDILLSIYKKIMEDINHSSI